ncbi:MAG: hypothetical protein KBG20_13215 [Caldilineaceae bacterium]|nr:hypothetical protein [Caldilineaceae bacterium]MBP8108661.1 hypothetical protein [Caldilineaceae bacterium]MBP8123202.1 hypothetical protein [Caldilineaceae bacterium]MBP9073257.1 hypothetical protein [Caldilineaceae bacterium]
MTTTVYVESDQATRETMYLVQSAISKEVATLKLAIRAGERRLAEFEKKYGVSSDYFIAEMAAEDMDEGDDEYIRWAGEFDLTQSLREKLQRLMEINYRDQRTSHSD